ncbi:response regulator transcription factor [Nocardioides bruguierae]|uniref:Response regulator transcription factor n=1 Tax=Nocardioides bruguierae TaxID=2945102 RepID=A0A9X2D5Y3_9ACTN|nr:response regulator transcription factor [Nocardioides bruguierae]MCL8027201.1 response regulator transcription factor [Nocardioides bruguierae]MCM0620007.1 response regulator transcription factor [Nocardioides bruguierae]
MAGPGDGGRVALVEDHQLFAESLELALSLRGHDVVRVLPQEVTYLGTLLERLKKVSPQLVLLDLDLAGLGDSTALIGPLSAAGIHVVVVTGSADEARWGRCLAAGARTVLPKSSSLAEIMGVVRRVLTGFPVMTKETREALVARWSDRAADEGDTLDRLEKLTPRERVVLGHLMAGRAVAEIAAVEMLSPATVRTQVKSVLAKLEVSSQLAAVGAAHRVGWGAGETDQRKGA